MKKVLIFVLKRPSLSFKTQPKIKSIPEWDAFFSLVSILIVLFLKGTCILVKICKKVMDTLTRERQ